MLRVLGLAMVGGLLLYLFTWPVVIEPVAWQPKPLAALSVGHEQPMTGIHYVALPSGHGPEDLAVNDAGEVFTGTDDGWIHKLSKDESGQWHTVPWHRTGGRVLGLEFDPGGRLLVADALLGLISISRDKKEQLLLDKIDGKLIGFLDDLDVLSDGRIVFSDASQKFPARDFGGTVEASRYDINEHGLHGAVYLFDPQSGALHKLADQLSFANGIAISQDERWVLVNETGNYRVLKVGIAADNIAQQQVVIDNLPGFPDNITRAADGNFWLGLVSPRNSMLDWSAPYPWLRKLAQRMPHFLQPQPERFGQVLKINSHGEVLLSLYEPQREYGFVTGAIELDGELILSSLLERKIAILPLAE